VKKGGWAGLTHRRNAILTEREPASYAGRLQRMKTRGWVAAALWVAVALVCAGGITAHDWYPLECCQGTDCAPVLSVQTLPAVNSASLPAMVVTTKFGSVLVPGEFPRRGSKDNRMHACMKQGVTRMHLLCLFIPPPS
jgi:heme A synthase